MREVIEALDEATKGIEVTVAVGVGTHQSMMARHFTWDYPKRSLLTSCGHGTMGSALPYAIGAQIAQPERLVLCVTGDGCWAMENIHFETCHRYDLPVKVLVLDNGKAGIVHQFETLNGIRHVATEWPNILERQLPAAPTLDFSWLLEPRPLLAHYAVSDIGVWPILEGGHQPNDMTEGP
jgi:thiamine pyrophosphate-dependent acetolactate synthase large subunit-like protein